MVERRHLRNLASTLSERPERTWPAGVVHHGARVLLLVGLALFVLLLFPVAQVPDFPVLEKGMVADEDVIAEVAFPIYKSEAELARERADAAAGVAPIFEYVPEAPDTMLERVGQLMARVDSAAVAPPLGASARGGLRELLATYGLIVTPAALDVLVSVDSRAQLESAVERAIQVELPSGIASGSDLEQAVAPQFRLRRDGTERLLPRDSLHTASSFFERAAQHLPPNASVAMAELQRLILIRFFEESVRLDQLATEAARDRARQAVPLIEAQVLRGERIVGAHEQVRDAELDRLWAYRQHLARLGQLGDNGGSFTRALGSFLFGVLILSIFGLVLYFFRPTVYHDFRHVLLIAFLATAFIGAAAIIGRTAAPAALIPIAFPALVVAALWDGRLALTLSFVLALLLGGQGPFLGISVLFTLVLAGAAASLSVRVVRRRAQTWVFVSIIAGAYIAAPLTLGLLRSREAMEIVWAGGWGILNAIGSALIAMGFLPLFETFTRITTDQTLLELGDLNNRPLLKRLALEANGTYHHSINVANLAEAAAQAIGANALLCRVGVYYHDIGKMIKPQYFIENQPDGRNPHDKLKPAMSAAIVRNHVIEGQRLAEEHNLPESVKAFIPEHHGTQPISFFYDKAQELNPEAELNPGDFTYPGPRPRSRETGIVMLADSVESAARVLQEPTSERIRELVDRIVDAKIAQGQLDETPLTLGELATIKEQFIGVLGGMHHRRIDYPAPRTEQETTAAIGPPRRAASGG